MLVRLSIKNYALIDALDMHFADGLNVITGETGTGKSIMLGALGLLLGSRADSRSVRDESGKCVVEGTFTSEGYGLEHLFEEANLDYEATALLRREVSSTGKSRAFINDTPVSLEVMRSIGLRLMSIHSQHEAIELKSRYFQLQLIDLYAANQGARKAYEKAWRGYKNNEKTYSKLLANAEGLKKEIDFISHQVEELDAFSPQADEQVKLEEELKMMEHAEHIKATLNDIIGKAEQMEGASIDVALSEVRAQIGSLQTYAKRYALLYQRAEGLLVEFRDIIAELKSAEERIDYDAKQTEQIKSRLDALHQLLHKHRVSHVGELIELHSRWAAQLSKNADQEGALQAARENLNQASEQLQHATQTLSTSRKTAFNDFCKHIVELLQNLGMEHARMKVAYQVEVPSATGVDSVELLFSANKGVAEEPLARVASGGEVSRIMFCIRHLLAQKTTLPTLVLDEIDAGVSGEIAIRLGHMMKAMTSGCQLVVITHLPQVAARAERHFYVYKEPKAGKTVSMIRALGQEERVEEVAKMISGEAPSVATIESARELMSL